MKPNKVDRISLQDGRTLEYAEYGDPDGSPQIFFHGFIGSYHQASPGHEAAKKNNLRLVAWNRPGVGQSTTRETQTIQERMDDVCQLLDALGIKECGAVGVSGGVPYALAAACKLKTRVKAVAAISGMGPLSDSRLFGRMEQSRKRTMSLGRFPWLVSYYLAYRMRKYQSLEILMQRWPAADRELFQKQSALRQMFLSDLKATLAEGAGTQGLAREMQRYFRWGFSLDDVPTSTPVHLWHGTDDCVVPHIMTEYMERRLPNAKASLKPGGHFMIAEIADEVMEKVRDTVR